MLNVYILYFLVDSIVMKIDQLEDATFVGTACAGQNDIYDPLNGLAAYPLESRLDDEATYITQATHENDILYGEKYVYVQLLLNPLDSEAFWRTHVYQWGYLLIERTTRPLIWPWPLELSLMRVPKKHDGQFIFRSLTPPTTAATLCVETAFWKRARR